MAKRWIMTVFGMLAALGGACSSAPKTVEKPEVALESIDIQKASLTDATVLLNLAVRNPNGFDLDIDSFKYGLNINGKAFASGTMAEGATIPANGEAQVAVPLRMKYWDLFSQFSELIKNKLSSYQITGTIGAEKREFPFQHFGEVKLPG